MKKNQYIGAAAIIIDKKKGALLGKRGGSPHEWVFGKWNFPAGGIEFGEDPTSTAIRETKEEVGVTIKLLSTRPFVYSHVFKDTLHHGILLAYPAQYVSGEIDTHNDPGTTTAQWFTIDSIDFSQCMPHTKEMIEDTLKEYFTHS